MPEFDYFNGENNITFDLLEIDDEKHEVVIAITNLGKISVRPLIYTLTETAATLNTVVYTQKFT